jgi:hypothetical protein
VLSDIASHVRWSLRNVLLTNIMWLQDVSIAWGKAFTVHAGREPGQLPKLGTAMFRAVRFRNQGLCGKDG